MKRKLMIALFLILLISTSYCSIVSASSYTANFISYVNSDGSVYKPLNYHVIDNNSYCRLNSTTGDPGYYTSRAYLNSTNFSNKLIYNNASGYHYSSPAGTVAMCFSNTEHPNNRLYINGAFYPAY